MRNWVLRFGNKGSNVNFRGKAGQIRPLRRDELLISKREVDEEILGTVTCSEVIGRKAWRVDEVGTRIIKSLVEKLNNGDVTSLETLEAMERRFEGGK